MTQKQLGQFYTHKNIFNHPAFIEWFEKIEPSKKRCVLEPFAGRNGIIKMLQDLNLITDFKSYDIVPGDEKVEQCDTLENFPKNFHTVITNPPFLARNVASRLNYEIKIDPYNDLYELCLNQCLNNTSYVAAIVPESFIVSEFFKPRLHTVISLAQKQIFKDTEHPVCLALFNPEETDNYNIYSNKKLLGNFKELSYQSQKFLNDTTPHEYDLVWHHPDGQVGLVTIDATDKDKKLRFIEGTEILSSDVNPFCRLRTRILILNHKGKPIKKLETQKLINVFNHHLKAYRATTHDVFLTAFKGLRTDSCYRRRLDFGTARALVNQAMNDFIQKN